jgi:GT2 family glycosyltransferase
VSVIVATRNRATVLPEALASLAAQRCASSFEIVVVDNGSDDTTVDVVREWERRDERMRSVFEPEIGLSRAKNAGIRAARGRLVMFTDDDVIVPEQWIATYVDFFSRSPATRVVAGGPVLPVAPDLGTWPAWLDRASRDDLPSLFYGHGERKLGTSEWLWGANMAAPRTVLESLDHFREELGRGGQADTFEDVDLVDRLRAGGGEAWYCPGAVVYHRVREADTRPTKIALTAFNRGCNDRARLQTGGYFEAALPAPRARAIAGLALPVYSTLFVGAALLFRITHRRRPFDLARRSSWASGWCMWAITGESARARARALRSAVYLMRRVGLRLLSH